jgi:hypothetical protein
MTTASQSSPPCLTLLKPIEMNANNDLITNWPSLHPPTHASNINMTAVLLPPDFSNNPPFPNNLAVSFPFPSTGGDNHVPREDTNAATGGEIAVSGGGDVVHDSGRPRRNVGTYKDGPAKIRRFPIDGESYELAYSSNTFLEPLHPVPAITNTAHCPLTYHPTEKVQKQFLAKCYFLQDKWFHDDDCISSLIAHMPVDTWDDGSNDVYFNDIADPRILAACSANKKATEMEDSPSFDTAIRSPFQAQWWKAMYNKLRTIMVDFDCWDYVKRTPDMNVLPSTWAFKLKQYPDGRVKKFKARFCARGDRQKEGVDYFETWAPVVQWSTVRIVMILAVKLNLISVQCDITAAFVHGRVPPSETIYVHQPRGFHCGNGDEVLRLKRTLYGLKQSSRYFFQYLTERLIKRGLTASALDPCLFLSKTLIVVIYVNVILIYGKSHAEIDEFIESMKKDDISLHKEGTAEGYLGVDINRDGDRITLLQEGLTKRIISALGLDSKYSSPVETPAENAALGRNFHGSNASGSVNYSSVIGMLLYLGHSRPDISFATHQCARYTHSPKQSHEDALICIGRYLKGTFQRGLVLTPSDTFKIDCYPDADFAGLWGQEDKQDPHSVRSWTGYVICLADCTILWKSTLQTEIALSTMEAEYVALSMSCRDLFPLIDITTETCGKFDTGNHNFDGAARLHIKIHEDNVGALALGKLEPRRMTPRSKHYAIKYHWFREHIGPRLIQLVKIATDDQLGDLFTKGLTKLKFSRLQKKLMDW